MIGAGQGGTPALPRPPLDIPSLITAELLARAGVRSPATWCDPLAVACGSFAIAGPLRVAAFVANILHETGGLTVLAENFNYSSQALVEQWPIHFTPALADHLGRTASHPADQHAIAERAYGGRGGNRPEGSGDGWLYRGRGAIQVTFHDNYVAEAAANGRTLAETIMWLETPDGACQSAARFWLRAGCNPHADVGDVRECRRLVNGAYGGIDDVTRRYEQLLELLGAARPAPAADPADPMDFPPTP